MQFFVSSLCNCLLLLYCLAIVVFHEIIIMRMKKRTKTEKEVARLLYLFLQHGPVYRLTARPYQSSQYGDSMCDSMVTEFAFPWLHDACMLTRQKYATLGRGQMLRHFREGQMLRHFN